MATPSRRVRFFPALLLAAFLSAPASLAAADKVSICFGSASSALLPIAREQGYFSDEKLAVELIPHTSGKNSIQAMLDGKCDLATTAQTPVVHHSFSRNDFLVLANLSLSDDFEKIMVRADRGIEKAADLRGRLVALPEFATQHYLMDTYLTVNGVNPSEVRRRYVHHNEALKLFASGEVDAIVHREPEVDKLLDAMGGKARVLPSRSLCVSAYMLVGRRDFVGRNPALVERLLKGLVRAEEYARKEPEKARAIAAKVYGADRGQMELIWSLHNYRIALDQSLFFILENMARWEIGLAAGGRQSVMPNYLDFIYIDGLKTVKPSAVTILR